MMLNVRELDAMDVPHLFCSDPRLADELAAVNRSIHRLEESITGWTYLDPEVTDARKEVMS